jgi:hypothetical protein
MHEQTYLEALGIADAVKREIMVRVLFASPTRTKWPYRKVFLFNRELCLKSLFLLLRRLHQVLFVASIFLQT